MAKTLYYTPKDGNGTKSFLVDDIDAYDAVSRFPAEYSLTAPKKAEVEEVKTELSAMRDGVALPAGADQTPAPAAPAAQPVA